MDGFGSGRPGWNNKVKLREHMASVVTTMKLSSSYDDFKRKLDYVHPRYDETMLMEFMWEDEEDTGEGL